MKLGLKRPPLPKQDLFLICVVLAAVVFTRVILVLIAPNMYFFDSYGYLNQALDYIRNGHINLGTGLPFVLSLGILMKIFDWIAPITVIQSFMILLSVLTVFILFLIGRKISGTLFAFLASILAAFEPYFISFSVVGHNDVFAIAMGLISFYFATTSYKLRYVITPLFFFLAVGTRPEFYPALVVPIVLYSIYQNWKSNLKQKISLFSYLAAVYVLPALWFYNLASTYTRFSPVQRLLLFLNPDLVGVAIKSIFTFYQPDLLNQILSLMCIIGVATWLVRTYRHFIVVRSNELLEERKLGIKDVGNFARARDLLKSKSVLTGICVCLIFGIYVATLVTFGFGYVITDGKLDVIRTLPERYLILPRLLLSFSLAYPFSLYIRWVYAKIAGKK